MECENFVSYLNECELPEGWFLHRIGEVGPLFVPILDGLELGRKQLSGAPRVSRRHARLTLLDQHKVLLQDLDSKYGTYVNDFRVSSKGTVLEDCDVVFLGPRGPAGYGCLVRYKALPSEAERGFGDEQREPEDALSQGSKTDCDTVPTGVSSTQDILHRTTGEREESAAEDSDSSTCTLPAQGNTEESDRCTTGERKVSAAEDSDSSTRTLRAELSNKKKSVPVPYLTAQDFSAARFPRQTNPKQTESEKRDTHKQQKDTYLVSVAEAQCPAETRSSQTGFARCRFDDKQGEDTKQFATTEPVGDQCTPRTLPEEKFSSDEGKVDAGKRRKVNPVQSCVRDMIRNVANNDTVPELIVLSSGNDTDSDRTVYAPKRKRRKRHKSTPAYGPKPARVHERVRGYSHPGDCIVISDDEGDKKPSTESCPPDSKDVVDHETQTSPVKSAASTERLHSQPETSRKRPEVLAELSFKWRVDRLPKVRTTEPQPLLNRRRKSKTVEDSFPPFDLEKIFEERPPQTFGGRGRGRGRGRGAKARVIRQYGFRVPIPGGGSDLRKAE